MIKKLWAAYKARRAKRQVEAAKKSAYVASTANQRSRNGNDSDDGGLATVMPFGPFGSGLDVTSLRQAAFVSNSTDDEDGRCRPQTITTTQPSGDDNSSTRDSSVTTDTGTCASDISSPSSID